MLVTPSELATYMDRGSFGNRHEDAASAVLLGLQGELESFLRRPVEAITLTDETHVIPDTYGIGVGANPWYGVGGDTNLSVTADEPRPPIPINPYSIAFRHTPILSISSIVVWTPTGSSTQASAGLGYVQRAWGVDMYNVNANDRVLVSYTAGPNGASALPVAFFKLLIMRAAAREMITMTDDVVSLKELSTEHVVPFIPGFTAAELNSVKRWKRKQITG